MHCSVLCFFQVFFGLLEWTVDWWRFSLLELMNAFGQCWQEYGFSLVWIALRRIKMLNRILFDWTINVIHLVWSVSVLACLNFFRHILHSNRCLASCTCWWDRKFGALWKLLSHSWHWNGRTPVWVRRWICSLDELAYLTRKTKI